MKTIGIVISPNNIFNRCIYYTSNRVFAQDNPNLSSAELNHAYAMSEDDRKYFFNAYYMLACVNLSKCLIPFRKRIIFTDNTGEIPNGFSSDYLTDRTVFYLRVSDKVALDMVVPIMGEILMLNILYEWYSLKNIYNEIAIIVDKISQSEIKLSRILSEYSSDNMLQTKYNMGFSNQTKSNPSDEYVHVGDIKIYTSVYSSKFD